MECCEEMCEYSYGSQAEVERLIFEDDDPAIGFVLHPDMKWVGCPVLVLCISLAAVAHHK